MTDTEPDTRDDPDRIRDPDDETGRKRRDRILDQRDDLLDDRREILQLKHTNELDHFTAMTAYRDTVESWLIEIEPLYLEFDPDTWQNEVIATTRITPPDGPDSAGHGGGGWDAPEPVEIPITLKQILDAPSPMQYEWEFTRKDHRSSVPRTETEYVTEPYQLSQEALDTAVRRTSAFLREIGFGVGTEENNEWQI